MSVLIIMDFVITTVLTHLVLINAPVKLDMNWNLIATDV